MKTPAKAGDKVADAGIEVLERLIYTECESDTWKAVE